MKKEAQLGLVVVEYRDFEGRYNAHSYHEVSIEVDFVAFGVPEEDKGEGEEVNAHIPEHGSLEVVTTSREEAV